ncbi:DHH family phosphoesterase [Pseudobacteroides cellulosolvens]|uniref:Phosphoesterase RecJ domain protein n=1 Tax=Pseudobacteroides cellulosolvens ATCC 35603 = DSM 2933 TaxID=398512 RepID=A0A0L6JGU1_9FIRM|nr:bifunctional oligoribonuclease/PAP phosphatase NrnA [Pseudobacteroides cellulosolvens]KNY24920.1 phosphoesterase RecJ domain protein [Pseudobacteroides cellulosolvens ATCC 35603 = DSM 2933]
MNLVEIISVIKDCNSIAILPHVQADGDAWGSCLALGTALKKLNKSVKIISEEIIPRIYNFLPLEDSLIYDENAHYHFDLVIALDTGDTGRLGNRIKVFGSTENTVNIDHHGTNTGFARYNYLDAEAAATGEIVYELINILNVEIDTNMATCLYVAIATDTGCFKFNNTTSKTHEIVSALVKKGVNVAEVAQRVFDSTTKERVMLMGYAINTLELFEEGRLAFISITNEMIKAASAKEEDCDGIVNIGRNIEGVESSVVIREKSQGEYKVNLRSKSYLDVGQVAFKFGGGGHKMAAGCTIKGDMDSVKKSVYEELKRLL